HRVPAHPAQLPAAADRRRDRAGCGSDRPRGDAVLSRSRLADHRTIARPSDRQRLPIPFVRQVLDQLLPRHCAAADDFQHQSGRRSAARRHQSKAAAMTDAVLSVEGLRTHFLTKAGVIKAVDDVSFGIARGEVLGLVGESGSGKSVTGYSIMGLVDAPGRIVAGRIVYRGEDITALEPEAMLAHERVPYAAAVARARACLAQVGIASPDARLAAYPHQFSGGMRQRVAIAIALLNVPDVIIADEPTTALDVTIQGQILFEMQKLTRETGAALVWITHDLSVIAGLADRVCVMYAGRIV